MSQQDAVHAAQDAAAAAMQRIAPAQVDVLREGVPCMLHQMHCFAPVLQRTALARMACLQRCCALGPKLCL